MTERNGTTEDEAEYEISPAPPDCSISTVGSYSIDELNLGTMI